MKKAYCLLGMLVCLSANAKDEGVVNGVYWPQEKIGIATVLKAGYHDARSLYIQPRKCPSGKYDTNSIGFRAISKEDHIVTGYVCDGTVYPTLTTVTEPGVK